MLHRTLFSTQWTNIEEQSYDIPGMSSDTMSLIIQYAYARPVLITEENVPELLAAADQFLISDLLDACCQFLEANLCPENCIGTCMLTECFPSCSMLHHKARLYVLQHFEEVLQVSEEFLELPLGHLEEMIAQDELNVKQEEMVFEAIVRWIGHATENRRKHIAVLLSKARQRYKFIMLIIVFSYSTIVLFANQTINNKLYNNNLHIKIQYNMWLRYTTNRKRKNGMKSSLKLC